MLKWNLTGINQEDSKQAATSGRRKATGHTTKIKGVSMKLVSHKTTCRICLA